MKSSLMVGRLEQEILMMASHGGGGCCPIETVGVENSVEWKFKIRNHIICISYI